MLASFKVEKIFLLNICQHVSYAQNTGVNLVLAFSVIYVNLSFIDRKTKPIFYIIFSRIIFVFFSLSSKITFQGLQND